MEDIEVKRLSLDFSQDCDLEAIEAKVLAFLKDDVAESGTVTCVIREAGELGDNVTREFLLGLGQAEAEVVEASANKIASYLAEYAKAKDGKLYSDATLEIHHPWHAAALAALKRLQTTPAVVRGSDGAFCRSGVCVALASLASG
jgi:hypothetical protein